MTKKSTSSATSEQTKATDTRLYIVRQKHRNDNDELHLVEASSAAQAIRIAAEPFFAVSIATPKDIAQLTGAKVVGGKVAS